MRLAECLNRSDHGILRKIAERHDFSCPLYSKNAILQEVLARFFASDYLAQRLSSLTPEARAAVREIAFDRRDRYAREELLALLRRVAPCADSALESKPADAEGTKKRAGRAREKTKIVPPVDPARTLLTALQCEGLIYPETGGAVFVCPADVWLRLYEMVSGEERAHVQSSGREPVAHRDDGLAMARDAATFLLHLGRQDIRLTGDGVIFRRQQAQLFQLFEIEEQPLPPHVGWRFGFGRRFHDYPDRFALLYDALFSDNLILEGEDGRLRANADAVQTYLRVPEDERGERFFRYWLKTYRAAIPNLRTIVSRLGEAVRYSWVYGGSLRDLWLPQIQPYYYESGEMVWESHILGMLVCLGVLARGAAADGSALYRLTRQGGQWLRSKGLPPAVDDRREDARRRDELAVIQPTFEILTPAEADGHIGWDLRAIAELLQSDRVRIYRLTRASIYRALQDGWTRDRLLAFLEKISAYPVPGNVERTVAQWCDAFGRIRVGRYTALTCRDEATAQEILQLQAVSNHITAKLSPTVFAIANGSEKVILETLATLGYLVQQDGMMEPARK